VVERYVPNRVFPDHNFAGGVGDGYFG